MSTPEMQLISRIVRMGQEAFATATHWGISEADFPSAEALGYWKMILGVHRESGSHGSIPGINTILSQNSNFILCDDLSMSTELICKQVRDRRLVLAIKEAASKAIENAELGPIEAAASLCGMMTQLMEVGSKKSTDVMFGPIFEEIMQDYDLAGSGVNTSKASWPWPSLQEATTGIQEDDYIVFYGRPKSMKSWVLCAIIAHLFTMDKKVLFYTKEMTPKNMYKRIASCLAEVPYQEFRRAKLTPNEHQRLMDTYNYVQSRSHLLICLSGRDAPAGGDTVQWFRSKVEHYKPDIAAIDGLYLMSSHGGPKQRDDQRVMSISREVSQMRLDLRTPVLATMQANRKAASHSNAELDEIAYSDAIGQDATIAFRVINEKGKPTIALVVGGSREFELHGVRIGGVPSVDFTEKEIMTAKDINKAKENDSGEVDAPEEHSKPRRSPRTRKDEANGAIESTLEQQFRNL